MADLSQTVAAEQQAISAGTATGCLHVCSYDATLTCVRSTHDGTMPHVSKDAAGNYVQFQEPLPGSAVT